MNKIIILFAVPILVSCSIENEPKDQFPQEVIIAGKVTNYDPDNTEINISVNRPGFEQEAIYTNLDSLGNFSFSFKSYIPTDVWLDYKMNFLVLTHPGDSIYINFDGSSWSRPTILETVKFNGDAAETNQDAAIFQKMYFSNTLYTDWDAKAKAVKEYDADEYITYLDTVKQKGKELFEQFVADVSPNEETKIWALTYIEEDYYNDLALYPESHRRENNLKWNEWDVPFTYYDPLLNRFPIKESMFISGFALMDFINRYQYFYVRNNLWNEDANHKYKAENGYIKVPSPAIFDSLNVYSIIKYTPDTLMRQLVLTDLFRFSLENYGIDLYEDYKDIVNKYILEPFLKEPLVQMYNQAKARLDHPQIASDAVLKKAVNSSANQIIDSIFLTNKGKVIYIDCWATWCGPCRSEMPNSKKLMKQLNAKNVAFIFLCLDSEEKVWEAALDEFDIGGQHYYLTKEQSNNIRKVFEISGVPYYLLIDKDGTIIEKGSHLRPLVAKEKILKLLE